MATYKASVSRTEDTADLILKIDQDSYSISLTEDNPNQVRLVFNEIIKHLKGEKFEFELEDNGDDLYSSICKEYIKHLNSEMGSIYGQLKSYKLLEEVKSA